MYTHTTNFLDFSTWVYTPILTPMYASKITTVHPIFNPMLKINYKTTPKIVFRNTTKIIYSKIFQITIQNFINVKIAMYTKNFITAHPIDLHWSD